MKQWSKKQQSFILAAGLLALSANVFAMARKAEEGVAPTGTAGTGSDPKVKPEVKTSTTTSLTDRLTVSPVDGQNRGPGNDGLGRPENAGEPNRRR